MHRMELSNKYNEALVEHKIILNILERKKAVESGLELRTTSESMEEATVEDFLKLSPVSNLEDFIHARKFTGKNSQKGKLPPPGKNLIKTVYRGQTMKLIEEGCSNKNPCLVFLAWSLRSSRLVLVAPTFPALSTSVPTPEFIFVYAS